MGKIISLDGTVYEGTWEQDKRTGKGRSVDGATGDIYFGDFLDGKKQGHGLIYHKATDQIYDGQWSLNAKNGEGLVLHRSGQLNQGDYRAGLLEGKTSLKQYIPPHEAKRIFSLV